MPNHTTNHLTVTGPSDSIVRMQEAVRNKQNAFSCNSVIPMPEELRDTTKGWNSGESIQKASERKQNEARLVKSYGYYNWYDWSVANWGTKWDVYSMGNNSLSWQNIAGGVYIEFHSAWEPPIPVIVKLGQLFPDLKFVMDYSDEGWGYAGELVCENGEVKDNCMVDTAMIEEKNREMGLTEE